MYTNRHHAQRAPSARPGFSMSYRECAQSRWVSHREVRRFFRRIWPRRRFEKPPPSRKKKLDRASPDFTYS